jgi:hypothetical protein
LLAAARTPTPAPAGRGACTSALRLETRVWGAVFAILKDPEQLRADLEGIEVERAGVRDHPDEETKPWADKLVERDRKRAKCQEMFAADAMVLEEL